MKKNAILLSLILVINFLYAHNDEHSTTLNCSVTIATNSVAGIEAVATGTPPFKYQWSNLGITATANAYPVQAGQYCVTVTDYMGCTADACIDWAGAPVDPNCSVDIETLNSYTLGIVPIGDTVAYANVHWDNGRKGHHNILNALESCVTVIYPSGCAASACYSWDPGCSLAPLKMNAKGEIRSYFNGFGSPTYLWSTGETTWKIAPLNAGTYCVTVTSANQCTKSACVNWSPALFQACEVSIEETSWINNKTIFKANPGNPYIIGTGPYDYLWSTGETTRSIRPMQLGEYCVTIIDSLGCQSNACKSWVPDENCQAGIAPLGADLLAAQPFGIAPYTYLWSNGSTTQTIPIDLADSPTVCVDITDATGCSGSACYDDIAKHFYEIDGAVILTGIDTTLVTNFEIEVYLIVYDPVVGTLTAVDQQTISKTYWETRLSSPFWADGIAHFTYNFDNAPDGNYLVKAAMKVGSNYYDDFLPTYHGDVLFWNQATEFTLPQNLGATYDINLVPGVNPGGPGFVGGFVSQGANLLGGATPRGEDDPIADALIFLLDENGEAIAYTYSDADGNFGFDGIAWGTYQVYIEIPGLAPSFIWVTIGPDTELIDDLSFVVNSDGIETVTSLATLIKTENLRLFPNPTAAESYLEIEGKTATEALLSIVNLQGQVVASQKLAVAKGHQYLPIALEELKAGLYFLNLQINGELITMKLVKQ